VSSRTLYVSVLGWSGTGKTTFIVKAIEECRRRGISAAAVKRARHEADVAPEGKDSTLYLEAGASSSLYVGDRSLVLFAPTPPVLDRAFYERHFEDVDIVFLEGAEVEGSVRVVVAGAATSPDELKRRPGECDLLIAASPELVGDGTETKVISPNAVSEILDFLEVHRGA